MFTKCISRIGARCSLALLIAIASNCTSSLLAKEGTYSGALGGAFAVYPEIDYGTGSTANIVKRGEYLARMGNCISCHTNVKENIEAFAGGPPIATPFGKFYGSNITPDKETGIGDWSEQDFIRAMREGLSPHGENYFPVFPYLNFSLMSRDDLHALWEYLKRIPPVRRANRPHDVPFPFNVRMSVYAWKLLYFYPDSGEFQYDPDKSPEWNRGAYLSEGLGHCGMCHTPINFMGGQKKQYAFTGNFIDGYWAPNITSAALKDLSIEDIANIFNQGTLSSGSGPVAGPMAEVIHNSLAKLTPEDQLAIATYLKGKHSKQPMGIIVPERMPTLKRGKKIYIHACQVCHQYGQAGAPRIGDGANWLLRAKQGREVLYEHTIKGFNSMPIRGGCVTCSDRDIRASVDYILHQSLSRSQIRQLETPAVVEKPGPKTGEKVYKAVCATCHDGGNLGAPKIGDEAVWAQLVKKDIDTLIHNTMIGSYRQPPKGGCEQCTTSEVIAAIKYMLDKSKPKSKKDYSLW